MYKAGFLLKILVITSDIWISCLINGLLKLYYLVYLTFDIFQWES